jgi:hypothetical protein
VVGEASARVGGVRPAWWMLAYQELVDSRSKVPVLEPYTRLVLPPA